MGVQRQRDQFGLVAVVCGEGTERSRLGAFGVLPALALTGQTAMGMYPSDLLLRSCTMVS